MHYINTNKKHRGLTLIEVLIALAVVSIALTAVIKSTSQSIRSTSYLRNKAVALWVGEQAMNSARVGVIKVSDNADRETHTTTMLGQTWYWRVKQESTPNKRIHKLIVSVYEQNPEQDEAAIITLESYSYAE